MASISGWILCLVVLPLLLKSLCLLLIALATVHAVLGKALLFYPWSLTSLHVNVKNKMSLVRKDGMVLDDCSLSSDSVVTPILTIIHIQPSQAAWYQRLSWYQYLFGQRLLVLPDSLNAEDFRQLRVWLLWGYDYMGDKSTNRSK